MLPHKEAELHGFKRGDRIIVLTIEYAAGTKRHLYAYDTAVSWMESGLQRDNIQYTRTIEQWDGSERVSFYNGD